MTESGGWHSAGRVGQGGEGGSAGTGSTPAGDGQDLFARVLQRHGFSERVARQVVRITANLARRASREDWELAAMVDAASGAQLGRILRGQEESVDIGPHIRAMRPGRVYVQLHTHRGDTPFSPQDGIVLVSQPSIRAMVVVGQGRTRYVLGRDPNVPPADPEAVDPAYRAAVRALRSRYHRLARSGAMTQQAADRARFHEAWQNVAPQLGLRHDRVEPTNASGSA